MYGIPDNTVTPKDGKLEPETVSKYPTRFLNVKAASTYLGVSKSYLDKLRCNGGGPKFHRHGRRIFYKVEDLDAWSDGRCFSSTSQYDGKE
jgi:hypothetical protein